MTSKIPEMIRMTQGTPPCGAALRAFLPFAGLNFAINAMVTPPILAPVPESKGMTRRNWFCFAAALAACGERDRMPEGLFPEKAASVWRRTALRDVPASEAPDPVPRNAVERIEAASYEGPGKIEARVYELTSPEVGLNLAQRWRPSSDTVFFNSRRFFVVVKWQEADRKALQEFVRDLEKRLAPVGPRGS